jgi:hypothetical protein
MRFRNRVFGRLHAARPSAMKLMFWTYLVLIAAGLAIAFAVGLADR